MRRCRRAVAIALAAAVAGCTTGAKTTDLYNGNRLTDAQQAIVDTQLNYGPMTIEGSVNHKDHDYAVGEAIALSVKASENASVAILRVLAKAHHVSSLCRRIFGRWIGLEFRNQVQEALPIVLDSEMTQLAASYANTTCGPAVPPNACAIVVSRSAESYWSVVIPCDERLSFRLESDIMPQIET